MRARTRHQLRETRWIVWFLTIGWWYLPTLFVVWVFYTTVKFLILGVAWIIGEVNYIGYLNDRSRQR